MQVIRLLFIFKLYVMYILFDQTKRKKGFPFRVKKYAPTPIVMKCSEGLVLSNINLPEQQGTNMPTGQTTPLTGWHHNSPPHPKYPNTSKPKR